MNRLNRSDIFLSMKIRTQWHIDELIKYLDAHYMNYKDSKYLEKVEQLLTFMMLAEIQQIQYEIDSLELIWFKCVTFIQFAFYFSIKIVPLFWVMEFQKIQAEVVAETSKADGINLIREKSEMVNKFYVKHMETKAPLTECLQDLSNADG